MKICRMFLMKLLPILLIAIWSFCPVMARPLQDIVYSPDGSKFLVRELSAAYLRDSATGKILKVFEYRRAYGSTYNSIGFAVFLSNETLILNDEKGDLIWWNLESGTERKRLSGDFKIRTVSPDRLMLAEITSANGIQFVRIYNSETGRLKKKLKTSNTPEDIQFVSGNKSLVGITSSKLEIISYSTGRILRRFNINEPFGDFVVSPRGDSILVGIGIPGSGEKIGTWLENLHNSANTVNLAKKYSDLLFGVNAVGYSGADQNLAFVAGRSTVSRKGILIVWNLSTGKIKQVVYNDIEIETAAFSPDGRTILFLDRHRGLILIDLASGVRLRNYNETPQKELVGFFRYTSDDQKCC